MLLPLCEHAAVVPLRVVQPIAPVITKEEGNPIISLLEAGRGGVCFNLNV